MLNEIFSVIFKHRDLTLILFQVSEQCSSLRCSLSVAHLKFFDDLFSLRNSGCSAKSLHRNDRFLQRLENGSKWEILVFDGSDHRGCIQC